MNINMEEEKVLKEINEKLDRIDRRLDRLEEHIDFIDTVYKELKNPLNVAKKFFGR